jgi:hypothetical protein
MRRVAGAVISVVVLLGFLGFQFFSGGELGGECKNDLMGCKGSVMGWFGPTCLMDVAKGVGYCTVECETDQDCAGEMGPGWGCYGSEVMDDSGTTTGEIQKVCYSPDDMEMVRQMQSARQQTGEGVQMQGAQAQPAAARPTQ